MMNKQKYLLLICSLFLFITNISAQKIKEYLTPNMYKGTQSERIQKQLMKLLRVLERWLFLELMKWGIKQHG